ncbi:MAG: histidine kinase [Bacillota bacterium]|nr:histidine kinase [Bacillota bacterium]
MKKKTIKTGLAPTSAFIFLLTAFLMAVFLLFLLNVENIDVVDKRVNNEVRQVKNLETKVIESEEAPAGCIIEHSFTLKEQHKYDVCLAFYTSHQYIKVFIGDKEVYHLQHSDQLDIIKTPGSNWTIVPLYDRDIGKQVRIELMPAYESVIDNEVEFLMGQETQIIVNSLSKNLPILMISGLAIVLGFIFLALSIYMMWKDKKMNEALPLGIFSVLLGMWRFTDTDFSPFLNPEKPVLLFYMSVLALMVGIIPMIKAQKIRTRGNVADIYCIIIGIISIVLMSLDLAGVMDIREVLKGVHVILMLGLIMIAHSLILAHRTKNPGPVDRMDRVALWVLLVGIIGDAVIFYTTGTSANLFFTLIAFLIAISLKGIVFIYYYVSNRNMLIDKERQLIGNRATMMMGQIRSHFVFNILNAISGMCKYDPEKADQTVVQFSRYLRANVDLMQNDEPVTFDVVLNRLEDYIALEQVRFADKINFIKELEVVNFKMPALILQPIVENSIKHGIVPKKGDGTIVLKTYEDSNNIYIKIIDDGVGYDTEKASREGSVGMKNIRFRLQYFMNGKMSIRSAQGKGTETIIELPKKGASV